MKINKKVAFAIFGASVLIIFILAAFGTLSPCTITKRMMAERILRTGSMLVAEGNPFAGLFATAGTGALDNLISGLTPLQCIKANIRMATSDDMSAIPGSTAEKFEVEPLKEAVEGLIWHEEIKRSPVDDSEMVVYTRPSVESETSIYGDKIRAMIGLACMEGNIGLVIATGEMVDYDSREYPVKTANILVRLDNEPAFQQEFDVTAEGVALRSRNSKSDILRWAKYKKALVRYPTVGGATRTFSFDMTGAAEKLPKLQKACNWTPD